MPPLTLPRSAELDRYLLRAGVRPDRFGPRVKRAALRTCQLWQRRDQTWGQVGTLNPAPGVREDLPAGKTE